MPTGYTADVQAGKIVTFKDFAIRCARAFGAMILMRDEPMDAQIPESFTSSTEYYDKNIAQADEVLKTVPALSVEECGSRARAEQVSAMKYYDESMMKTKETNDRYSTMLEKVRRWAPPTPDHEGMKKFMIDQLTESLRFDAYSPDRPALKTPEEWRTAVLTKAKRDLEYHSKERAKEIERTEQRNLWIPELRRSLDEYQETQTA